jgi:hypothetical protein
MDTNDLILSYYRHRPHVHTSINHLIRPDLLIILQTTTTRHICMHACMHWVQIRPDPI